MSCLYIAGCATNTPIISPQSRTQQANQIAQSVNWKAHTIHTKLFTLQSYGIQGNHATNILTIYIEGDGLAWISQDMPSDNPTPIVPTGLKIATHHPKNHSVAYLARPCQFVFNQEWKNCQSIYWTNSRFSPEVIEAMNQAVDDLKQYYHAQKIILIGYSGGGTIATLIAERRNDVIKLITIAAVLNTQEWTNQENLTPLNGSLNPADAWKNLVDIPQTHWVGGKDDVVPKQIAFDFVNQFPAEKKPQIIVIPNFDHTCCWATQEFQ